MSSTNAITTWDFTISAEKTTNEKIISMIKEQDACKQWCFQLERGDTTGFMHYQGRLSYKVKTRNPKGTFEKEWGVHWSPTSKENRDNQFYVCKTDTRVNGPWMDTDVEIPWHIKGKTAYKWQQQIIDSKLIYNDRMINIVYDPTGNHGKSVCCAMISIYKHGVYIPYVNDIKEISQMVYGASKSKQAKNLFVIDIPKSAEIPRMKEFFSGLEKIKDGYCYDNRYTSKADWIGSPNIWIFTNSLPPKSYVSIDRWKYWVFENDEKDCKLLEVSYIQANNYSEESEESKQQKELYKYKTLCKSKDDTIVQLSRDNTSKDNYILELQQLLIDKGILVPPNSWIFE